MVTELKETLDNFRKQDNKLRVMLDDVEEFMKIYENLEKVFDNFKEIQKDLEKVSNKILEEC